MGHSTIRVLPSLLKILLYYGYLLSAVVCYSIQTCLSLFKVKLSFKYSFMLPTLVGDAYFLQLCQPLIKHVGSVELSA